MSDHGLPLALRQPLQGSRLIEASAGTGKTYTISGLYLRLVLGGGQDGDFPRPLLPPEILVVTFTEAATRELRDRIRARLVEAARAFRQPPQPPLTEALLQALRQAVPPERWALSARRLEIAAQWMDEAAVSTIHSWCQRMLREHAFDSGSLFQQTVETDLRPLQAEVVRDYWRQQCYPLDGAALAWVAARWKHPDGLQQVLRTWPGPPPPPPEQSLGSLLQRVQEERQAGLHALKAPWGAWADELEALLDQAREAKQLNGSRLRQSDYRRWLQALRDWAQGDGELPDLKSGLTRLTPAGLAEVWKQGSPPAHPALAALAALPQALEQLPDPDAWALRHACGWVTQQFELEQRRRAQMGFDDMLRRLDAALQGPGGENLAAVIRRQFPVAMIDEFQDTDALQYRIFDAIYRVREPATDRALLLIGDPKQSIYGFRGADIRTYLRAKADTAGRHTSLDTNHRSSDAMVQAVNALFQRAEARGGAGAFLFRQGADDPLPFVPVHARGRTEQWQVQGQPQPALTCWHLQGEQPWSQARYREDMAARCATEITRLLTLGQQHQAGFVRDGTLVPLQASDVAVLVRSGREAAAVRQALFERGVRSVYLSDKDSVWQSAEAVDLVRWLRACAEPDRDRWLRAALATPTLGLSLAALDRLGQDELHWEQRVLQFRGYRDRWQRQGVLPMLRQLLQDFELPARLLSRDGGERSLTNLLHLAELLQQAAAELDGEQALLRAASEALERRGEGEDTILRLESDAALVRVVTIHKSKGLEYPLVFLPFICSFRNERGDTLVLDAQGLPRRAEAHDRDALDQERLAEDLRLLYVALTRARHACWLGVADVTEGQGRTSALHRSALGYLLGGGEPLEHSAALAEWLAPCAAESVSQVLPAPEALALRWSPPQAEGFVPHWRVPSRRRGAPWWIASYSALQWGGEAEDDPVSTRDGAPATPAAQRLHDDDAVPPATAVMVPVIEGSADWHGFPRGPQAGTFLHGLLEWAGREGFATLLAAPERLREQVARRCQVRGWEHWIEPLCAGLRTLLQRPLPLPEGPGAGLAALPAWQPEMEFWLEVSRVPVEELDRRITEAIWPQAARPRLRHEHLNGLFKGFIDLGFEHGGRYYVADYKSNWLGPDDAAYTQAAMREAMLAHRYDLQAVLYLLALHRQLKLRKRDYDPDHDLGGALFLFLRGQVGAGEGGLLLQPPSSLIEDLDRLFRGEQGDHHD